MMNNGTLMQYFEWYLPNDIGLWNKISNEAENLKNIGISALWLPPAYKGKDGKNDVGYSVYDLYDLGEFNQKGSIETKYGSKDEYLKAIKALKDNNIDSYVDISLDHRIGADETEEVVVYEEDYNDRNKVISDEKIIEAWTKFNFPNRKDKYSSFKWNSSHFDGVDWDERRKKSSIYRFKNKSWNNCVDCEYGNFDYLMGADIDFSNEEAVQETINWSKWYLDTVGFDGIRLDAIKHISYEFITRLIDELRESSGKELFTVGEYWHSDINVLEKYIKNTDSRMSLFDVPLHYKFFEASNSNGNFDMRNLIKDTIMERDSVKAVTFVDNHDTQIGQALQSWVQPWFKPLAYCVILLRQEGYPCIFYGDYYGIPHNDIAPIKEILDKLMYLRLNYAYGKQNNYFDDCNIVGWTREGDEEHNNSGLAALITDGPGGSKKMYVGRKFSGCTFYDYTLNNSGKVIIDEMGMGNFYVNGGSISVWIKE